MLRQTDPDGSRRSRFTEARNEFATKGHAQEIELELIWLRCRARGGRPGRGFERGLIGQEHSLMTKLSNEVGSKEAEPCDFSGLVQARVFL